MLLYDVDNNVLFMIKSCANFKMSDSFCYLSLYAMTYDCRVFGANYNEDITIIISNQSNSLEYFTTIYTLTLSLSVYKKRSL